MWLVFENKLREDSILLESVTYTLHNTYYGKTFTSTTRTHTHGWVGHDLTHAHILKHIHLHEHINTYAMVSLRHN